MDFPAVEFAPDAGETSAMLVADGVLPLQDGYGPFPDLIVAEGAEALATAPRGLYSYSKADGSWETVAGTDTTIELLSSTYQWSSIDTGLTPTAGYDFSFSRAGTKLLYTNPDDGLRQYDVQAGGAASAITDAGYPAQIFQWAGRTFGLNCLDASATRDNRLIRNSEPYVQTNWKTKGADKQIVEDGGALQWGSRLSNDAAIVLQERGARVLTLGGPGSAAYSIGDITQEFGTVSAKACVASDGRAFWPSTDGFRMFSLGGVIEHIGAGKVDQWFYDRVDQAKLYLTQATLDPFRKNVLWRWKRAVNSSETVFEDIIGFNWIWRKWFTLTVQTSYIGYTALGALQWDEDTGTWDDDVGAWDDRAIQGGQPLFGGTDGSYKFGTFSGMNLAATLTHNVANNPVTGLVARATPMTDSANVSVELGVKNALSDAITYKTAATKQASGRVPLRGSGLNINFRSTIPAGEDWSYYKGIDHVAAASGGPR